MLLEMRFSKDYPHVPPFVRVVRPKFAFRTGHVRKKRRVLEKGKWKKGKRLSENEGLQEGSLCILMLVLGHCGWIDLHGAAYHLWLVI